MNTEQAKEAYISCFKAIRRAGANGLLQWMERNGFFEAPASTRYHGSFPGGLVIHSMHVFRRLLEIVEKEAERGRKCDYNMETLVIVSLLHDICKTDEYEQMNDGSYRPTKNFPAGHGEKSVFIILRYMHLTEEEMIAIRWHMGPYDFYAKGGGYDLDNAFKQCKLAVMLHLSDMMATHFDERGEESEKK